jgi:hypothetical protein
MNTAMSTNHPIVFISKTSGKRRMFLVSSNSYQDREREIVKQAALESYVNNFLPNDLLFWHTGQPIGRIIKAEMVGSFLVEEAVELPNRVILTRTPDGKDTHITTVKAVWDLIENNPDVYNAASVGFGYQATDKRHGVYERIRKFETSVLPWEAAANAYTYVGVDH